MNNYSKITNPLTNETVSIFSTEGKFLLKNYIKQYNSQNGGFKNILYKLNPYNWFNSSKRQYRLIRTQIQRDRKNQPTLNNLDNLDIKQKHEDTINKKKEENKGSFEIRFRNGNPSLKFKIKNLTKLQFEDLDVMFIYNAEII